MERNEDKEKQLKASIHPKSYASDLSNTLKWEHFQPKSLNCLLPLIGKDPIEYGSELTNGDVSEIVVILRNTYNYFFGKIYGGRREGVSVSDIEANQVEILKKCLDFLNSDKNFRLMGEVNKKLASINDLDFYINSALDFIRDVESGEKDLLITDDYLETTCGIVLLVFRYLEDSIEFKKSPEDAEAQLFWPPIPTPTLE